MTIEFLTEKVLVPLLVSVLALFGGYRLAALIRRSQILVERRLQVAEELAAALQEDRDRRTQLAEWFHLNYQDSIAEGIADFCNNSVLHADTRQEIADLREATARLWSRRREAELYLDDDTIADVERYVQLTRVNSLSDGGLGLIDTYYEEFLTRLLDKTKRNELSDTYARAFRRLRAAVRKAA